YLNHVYLGHGAYGVEAAADVYFGKHVDHLTVAEGAMLAGLVKGPSRYSPHNNMDLARERQLYVLERMHALQYVTTAQFELARGEPLAIIDDERPLNHVGAPYFVEHIRRWAVRHFGEETVLHGGLRIYTTLDTHMQRSAEAAVRDGLEDLDDRIGFRGPLGHLEGEDLAAMRDGPARPYVANLEAVTGGDRLIPKVPYVGAVVETSGAYSIDLGPLSLPMTAEDARRLRAWRDDDRRPIRAGDLLPVELAPQSDSSLALALAQRPDVQAGMVVIDPASGRVRAMVGGYDFAGSQFNRVTQAKRQIGSAIKPFIYSAAMADGMNQLDVVADAPVAVRTAGGVWAPGNYDGQFIGNVTLRTALAKSLNTVSVRLLVRTGVDKAIDMMRALGIRSKIPRHVSIALGTPDLTLLEVTSAYATFPSGGLLVEPRFVDKVVSGRGDVIFDDSARRPERQVIAPELAYTVVDLMGAVVDRGTARNAQELGRPAAGKTGTSTGHRDAWFIGYTADLVAGVWVGRDDFTPIGAKATGGSAALPIWLQFMKAAHPDTEPRAFEPPADVVFVRANEMTGQPAPAGSYNGRLIPFAVGSVPERFMRSVVPGPFRASVADSTGP
ncbi:MAG TPA: penicillin-binding transpeptidase domain-containing protein, partial [Kofleriaceae bacterium]|nr:penicillin-binding transpeptidase domain-containing protein [Kofleriaceae bacterium]